MSGRRLSTDDKVPARKESVNAELEKSDKHLFTEQYLIKGAQIDAYASILGLFCTKTHMFQSCQDED